MKLRANSREAQSFVNRLSSNFNSANADRVVEKVAFQTQADLIRKTPKLYTGMTRRSWIVQKQERHYIVTNTSKVMLFLELGTRAHGPVEAKFLFIPLNRRASIGGWNPGLKFGKDYILTKWVKGIQAMKIVENQRPITQKMLLDAMTSYIRGIT
jgi:hypothetical protein